MRLSTLVKGLCVPVALLCATSAISAEEPDKGTLDQIKQALDELKKLKQAQPQQTINTNTLAIESWLLTSTAINATAANIHNAVSGKVPEGERKLLVLAGDEPLDFNQSDMLKIEMDSLFRRLQQASGIKCPTRRQLGIQSVEAPIALVGAIADLLKSETELTAIDQTVDAKLLAAAVAGKFGNAVLPSAAIAAKPDSEMLRLFNELIAVADNSRLLRYRLAANENPSNCEQHKLDSLKLVLASFDKFYARVTTADEKTGMVPIVLAARLDQILDQDPVVLRVTMEKSGGTLLKRKNLLTAFGAETAFISGGLVSSYQLTRPKTGELIRSGVITCRTTMTSLKRVQEGSWTSPTRIDAADRTSQPLPVCFQSISR
jgi:hypothetical protein